MSIKRDVTNTPSSELGRVLSLRRTRLTPESIEMCICLKDHLDAIDRAQNLTNLEDEIKLETRIHEEEVEEGLSPDISDEKLAQEAHTRKRTQTQTP
ncbi:hypothetical protein R6Q59_028162 [Mikania micrantha]